MPLLSHPGLRGAMQRSPSPAVSASSESGDDGAPAAFRSESGPNVGSPLDELDEIRTESGRVVRNPYIRREDYGRFGLYAGNWGGAIGNPSCSRTISSMT